MKRRKRSRRLLIGFCTTIVALIAVLVAAWSAGLLLHDSSEAASLEQALHDFRTSTHGKLGLNGVYLYATEGRESINALGGASHTYPLTTSITVIEVPCGLRLRWAALEGRSTTWTFCSTAAGIELRRSDERHTFFGQTDHMVYACSGRLLLPKRFAHPSDNPFGCESRRNSEPGNAHVFGQTTLEVGKSRVRAVHARTTLTIHRGDRGTETIDWWLDTATGLPLRIVLESRTSRSMFVGTVRYREKLSLRLLSLQPRR
jgi:hypothetical protein